MRPINILRMRKAGAAATDPYFANVVALLHLNGTAGSTTFTDVTGKTWTAYGTPTISTTYSKFGGSSMAVGVSSGTDGIYGPTSADFAFGTGDFTVEGWIFCRNRVGEIDPLYSISNGSSGTTSGFVLYARHTSSSGAVRFFNTATGASTNGTTALADDTWYHVALSRTGSTLKVFLDGVQEISITDATNFTDQQRSEFGIARGATPSQPAVAFIDEVRITKGVGRYTANFTPPTAPFPDS